jgi:hypothetical protein
MPWRPEEQLLVCCARKQIVADKAAIARALIQQELDWNYLHELSLAHGMLPLLYANLNDLCPDGVPQEWGERLHAESLENAQWSLRLTAELFAILDLFADSGVAAIAYKGPVLATLLYGNAALRQFGDIDILVQRRELPKAFEVLRTRGYRPELVFSPAQERLYVRHGNERVFVREGSKVQVDLHWGICLPQYPFALSFESLCSRLAPVTVSGREIRTVVGDDLLILLCVHATYHRWARLALIAEVAEVVSASKLDWPAILERTRKSGSRRMLGVGISAAHSVLGAPLPKEVLDWLKTDRRIEPLTAEVGRGLFGEQRFDQDLFVFRTLGWVDKCRYCLAPAAEEFADMSLPFVLAPLYYLRRPFRLAAKALKAAVGR